MKRNILFGAFANLALLAGLTRAGDASINDPCDKLCGCDGNTFVFGRRDGCGEEDGCYYSECVKRAHFTWNLAYKCSDNFIDSCDGMQSCQPKYCYEKGGLT